MSVCTAIIIGIFSGVGGVIIGAYITHKFQNKLHRIIKKRELAFEMYKLFESKEYLIARNVAHKAIEKKKMCLQQLEKKYKGEKWICISMVFHFFQRLSVLIMHEEIDVELTRDLLGTYADFWLKFLPEFEEKNGFELLIKYPDILIDEIP